MPDLESSNAKLQEESSKYHDLYVNAIADAEVWHLQWSAEHQENAKLRELLKHNGAIIEACTSEILDHIGVPYIVGPAGVAQALMEATAMLVHKHYDLDPPSFYKEDK